MSKDNSVFSEPHMMEDFSSNPSDINSEHMEDSRDIYEKSEQSVFSENITTFSTGESGDTRLNYHHIYEESIQTVTLYKTLLITVLLALSAGPLAVAGVFMSSFEYSSFFLLNVVIIGPAMEEALKTGALLMTVEKRPWFFKNGLQIILIAAAGGLLFGVIENLLYFNYYIKNPTSEIIRFRWIVCTSLHVGCSLISGMGIRRVWLSSMKDKTQPRTTIWFPWFITAFIVHAIYNGSVTLAELGKNYFF
ncbi:PrsW family intramembrane metalloprotease [Myxococcota bacterium]|nr:PrsW family intramembrane metalloprotease [Myxococcota bacterium]MBU1380053.1 PrsW family intramembrane metalloprotease [Myxococcota bacterium]MBU1495511.1 PrsW family intramembrane metalloprotease [Myxococcota bacterium]